MVVRALTAGMLGRRFRDNLPGTTLLSSQHHMNCPPVQPRTVPQHMPLTPRPAAHPTGQHRQASTSLTHASALQALEQERKAARQAAAEERRAAEQGARQAAAAAYQDAEWIRAAEEEQLRALDAEAPDDVDRQVRPPHTRSCSRGAGIGNTRAPHACGARLPRHGAAACPTVRQSPAVSRGRRACAAEPDAALRRERVSEAVCAGL